MSQDVLDKINNFLGTTPNDGRPVGELDAADVGAWVMAAKNLLQAAHQLIADRANTDRVIEDMLHERFHGMRFSRRVFPPDMRARSTRNFKLHAVDPDTMKKLLSGKVVRYDLDNVNPPEHGPADCVVVDYLVCEVSRVTGDQWLKEAGQRGCSSQGQSGRRWEMNDISFALEMHDAGKTAQEIARELGRTEAAAGNKLDELLHDRAMLLKNNKTAQREVLGASTGNCTNCDAAVFDGNDLCADCTTGPY